MDLRPAAVAASVAALLAVGSPRAGDPEPRLTMGVAAVQLADGLGALTAGQGDAWIDDRWGERLLRVDGRSGRVVARIAVDGRLALSADGPYVWALQSGGGYGRGLRGPLLRIDAATNTVTKRIPLISPAGEPVLGFGVVARDGWVWVWGPDRLLRYDPFTGHLAQLMVVREQRGEATGFALDGAPVITTADGHLVRYDNGGWEVSAVELDLRSPVLQHATRSHAVVSDGGSVAAVEPESGRVLWRTRLGFRIGTVLEARGALWAQGAYVRDPGDRIWRLDPRTGAPRGSALLPGFGTMAMAAIGDALWVTSAHGRAFVVPFP